MLRNTLYLILVFLSLYVTNSPVHSADFPTAFDDDTPPLVVEGEMKKMKALLDMAIEFGDVEKYTNIVQKIHISSKKYIWDKLTIEIETTKTPDEDQQMREAKKKAFHELIKNHVMNDLPQNFRNSIFKHKLSALTAQKTNAALARKLSFFYMEELNLFVINESLKFLKRLDKWFIKHFDLSEGQLDWSNKFKTWENVINKIEGRIAGYYQDLARFPIKMFRELKKIGPRQAQYSEYMHTAQNFSEKFPPMHVNGAENQSEVKFDKLDNGMFCARAAVTELLSKADGTQWVDPDIEKKIKAYLN